MKLSKSQRVKVMQDIAGHLESEDWTMIDHKKLQDKMADVVIDLFVNSRSFASAKDRIGYVDRLKTWDSSYTPRIKKALKTNSQISGSWGFQNKS